MINDWYDDLRYNPHINPIKMRHWLDKAKNMSENNQPAPVAVAIKGVMTVIDTLRAEGVKIEITPDQIIMIGEGLLLFVNLINGAMVDEAKKAGNVAAASVTTVERANEIMRTIAEKEGGK